ncbi:hypothetical protein [Terribacillus saccharophilus]|uniref:hypothetical protein n=1 Tax=Terribacillus saccharophilus TaxID=361277 RepID=UPI000C99E02A|nr:hypothetical protein [Terribacillus goriensis]
MDFSNELLTRARKLNLYVLPQYVWLILLYYLMINSLYNLFASTLESYPKIPQEVLIFNNVLMGYIEEWSPFLWFLSISLIISGILIAFIRYLPVLSSYNFSYRGDIGIYLGSWILLISITIYLYENFGSWFHVVIPLCYFVIGIWEKIKNSIFS